MKVFIVMVLMLLSVEIKCVDSEVTIGKSDQRKTESTCGGIFSESQFLIESPGYPSNYPSNVTCLYIFKGAYCPTNYTLQFLDFNVEDSLGCVNDRLEVKARDAFCGTRDGFKQYVSVSGILELNFVTNGDISARGFRILVSRSSCLNDPLPNLTPTTLAARACCTSTPYAAKRFFISSPEFPRSLNKPEQCTFTIRRATPRVCRLRIQMHYFWIGRQNPSCSEGYLEIDGKLLCGCHTGLRLVSPFDGRFTNEKVLRYANLAAHSLHSPAFSGFVLEVIQDECPKRYSPDAHADFSFYDDQSNRVGFPNSTHAAQLSAATLNTEWIDMSDDESSQPRVVKHVYFFAYDDDDYKSNHESRDVENINYMETVDLAPLSPSGNNLYRCTMWNQNEWISLRKDTAWQQMPQCQHHTSDNAVLPTPDAACKEYSFVQGYFQSPGYPHYYPNNLNCCYRFYKRRGYCQIRLTMLDFQIEDSYDCGRDYLLLSNNFRYCGHSLANTFTLFDMSGKSYEQLRFVTNRHIHGRGFRGIYEQIPCLSRPHTSRPPLPTTPPPSSLCLHIIKDDYFAIDIYTNSQAMCKYDVYKAKPNMCRLEITFDRFDFPCGSDGYLEINKQQYCGSLSGETVYTRFGKQQVIEISYRRAAFAGLRVRLIGRQYSTDCDDLPPAQRILKPSL